MYKALVTVEYEILVRDAKDEEDAAKIAERMVGASVPEDIEVWHVEEVQDEA